MRNPRLYINIKTLRDEKRTEIHNALNEVCGEHTFLDSIISSWATYFRKDASTSTGLKTLTDKQSLKLVVNYLQEDCKELSQGLKFQNQYSVFL